MAKAARRGGSGRGGTVIHDVRRCALYCTVQGDGDHLGESRNPPARAGNEDRRAEDWKGQDEEISKG